MNNIGSFKSTTANGFEQTIVKYQAQNCKGCPLKSICNKGEKNRIINRNHNLDKYRKKARDLLNSKQGIKKRKQRCTDVETVFGDIKQNMKFRRFNLRGEEKVNVEMGIISIAHNLKKCYLAK